MTMDEARELVSGSLWPKVRDRFLETGSFELFPKGDPRRLEYLDEGTKKEVELWLEALGRVEEWKTVVDGEKVREIRDRFDGVYPEVFRYRAYFADLEDRTETVKRLLRLKFPDAYAFCFEEGEE